MHSGSTRFWIWIATGGLVVLVVVLLNFALTNVKTQIDLTEDQRFTLPPAAAVIAASLEDTCKVTAYISEQMHSRIAFVERVLRTRLEEFAKASDGKITFEFIDPGQDKALIEELKKRNPPIQAVQGQDAEEGKVIVGSYYLTLVFRYGDQEAVYNLTEMQQALYQEAEFSKSLPFQIAAKIVKLKNPDKKVGIASEKKPMPQQPGQQQQPEPTDGLTTLRESIGRHMPKPEDVQIKQGIPIRDDIDTLLVYRPEDLDERALYELDQFLMKGKKVMLLLDNFSLFDIDRIQDYQSSLIDPLQKRMQGGQGDFSSLKIREIKHGMKEWLAHYGVNTGDGWIEDRSNAKSVRSFMELADVGGGRMGFKPRQETTDLPGFLLALERGEDKKATGQFSDTSPALAGLGKVTMSFAVPMSLDRDAVAKHGTEEGGALRVKAEEILRTTRECWTRNVEDSKVKLFYPGDAALPDKGEWGSRPLVVSLHGRFKSYFAGKKYGESDRPPRLGPDKKELPEGPSPAAKLDESASPGQLWIFADSDFVSDWSFPSQRFQYPVAGVLSSQAAVQGMGQMMVGLVNILDTMTVGDELVEIRRPQIVDRSLEQTALDKDKSDIQLKTVVFPVVLLIALGILRWLYRIATTRARSPAAFAAASGTGASTPIPAGAEEV